MKLLPLLALVAVLGVPAGDDGRYGDPTGWSLRYPADFRVERSSASLRISISEVTVASFAAQRAVQVERSPDRIAIRVDPPRDAAGEFPVDGVAFRVVRLEGGALPILSAPESRFPLALSRFKRSSAHPGTEPRPLELTVHARGRTYVAYAWIGRTASAARRAQLERIVASLAFRPLRPGQVVGTFTVLGRAARYPVGSFTPVRAERTALYLVRAPRGFYAVRSPAACRLDVDRRRQRFFCSDGDVRWDRLGRLVDPRTASPGDGALGLRLVKRGWDGHLLLEPGWSVSQRAARALWR